MRLTPTPIDQLPPECRLAGRPRDDIPLGIRRGARGKIISARYENGIWRAVTRDAHGNVLTNTRNSGYWEWYTSDASGRPLTFESSLGDQYEYTYDRHGNVLTYRDARGKWYTYTRADDGTTLTYEDQHGVWRVLAYSAPHTLRELNGVYHAGCFEGTLDEAIARWEWRNDRRAVTFMAALLHEVAE